MNHLLIAVSTAQPAEGHQADAQSRPASVDTSAQGFARGSGVHLIPPADTRTAGTMGDARWWQICDRAAGALISAPRARRRARMQDRLARLVDQVGVVRRLGEVLGR